MYNIYNALQCQANNYNKKYSSRFSGGCKSLAPLLTVDRRSSGACARAVLMFRQYSIGRVGATRARPT